MKPTMPSQDAPRPRLGRGLAALMGETGDESGAVARARGQKRVPIEFLRPNPRNPRKHFDETDLSELAESIREKGIIQPILARTIPGVADAYEIIAGERRWRAAQRAGLHEAPIIVIEAGDKEALELAIIENVQRADLNALEEARGYQQLGADFAYSQADLAKVIGKSRSHVANTMRLLKLPDAVQAMIESGAISAGHARALLAVADAPAIAQRIVAQGLTVRDVERLAQVEADGALELKSAKPRAGAPRDPDTRALEARLSEALGLNVRLSAKGEGGEVRIRYVSLDQLDSLCERLAR